MRIGFKSSQVNVDWPTLLATGELADTREVFDSGWIFDHFVTLGVEGDGSTISTTTCGIAERFETQYVVVPHTGIAASLRRSPTEYGCNGGLRAAPVGSGRLEGTSEGTQTAPTKRLTAASLGGDREHE